MAQQFSIVYQGGNAYFTTACWAHTGGSFKRLGAIFVHDAGGWHPVFTVSGPSNITLIFNDTNSHVVVRSNGTIDYYWIGKLSTQNWLANIVPGAGLIFEVFISPREGSTTTGTPTNNWIPLANDISFNTSNPAKYDLIFRESYSGRVITTIRLTN